MKRVFIALVIATVFVSILGGALAKRKRNSTDTGQSQAHQEDSVEEARGPTERPVHLASVATEETEKPTETADRILTDISDANVTESTDNLKYAFSRLSELCQIAVKTRDAMLSAKYNNGQAGAANDEKGTEDDSE